MDDTRFDAFARRFATPRTRRETLRILGGAIGGGLLGLTQQPALAAKGNSACAHFCARVFGADTPAAGKCTSDAAHGTGTCVECNANPNNYCNGACTHASDPSNCGTCGNSCKTTGANTTATCTNGTCGFTCNAGFKDCNNDPSDGCETAITADVKNCGGCGVVCGGGDTCNAPVCTNGVCATESTNEGMRCNGGAGKCSSGTCKACGVHNAPCVSDSDCCAGFCTGGGTAQGVCSCYTSGIPVGDESQCCNGSQFINYTIVCN